MFEVWKRAQRSRLEDQRGTKINGELPDFLKPKSNSGKLQESSLKKGDGRGSTNRHSFAAPMIDDFIELSNPTPVTSYDFVADGTGIIPTHRQAEHYFSNYSMDLDANFDRKIRLVDHAVRPRQSAHGGGHRYKHAVKRPVSHPVFGYETRDYLDDQTRSRENGTGAASEGDLDKTLEYAKDLELDEFDATLKDDSFSPSCIPPPTRDIGETSIHVDTADYSPPSPLKAQDYLPMRLSSPPPLPPKPKLRGPPPRPPGRPQTDTPTSQLSPVQQTKMELMKQSCRSRKPVYVDRDGADRLNISFV